MGYKIAMENANEDVINIEVKGEGEYNYLDPAKYEGGLPWLIRIFKNDNEAESAGNGLGVFYFPVDAGCTYMASASGAKISWCGIYFSDHEASTVLVENTSGESKLLLKDSSSPYKKVELTVNDAHGSVEYNNTTVSDRTKSFYVESQSEVVLNITPNDGYRVERVLVNGEDRTNDVTAGKLTIASVTEDTNINVRFIIDGPTASLTVGPDGMATYCSADALDFSEVKGIRAYVASGFDPADGKLLLMHVNKVPAGTGLLIKSTPGTYSIPVNPHCS